MSGIISASIPQHGGTILRITLMPGEPLDGQPQEVVDAASEAWTPEVVEAFLSSLPPDETPQPPTTVTARQVRLWLVQNGHQLAQVESALDAIPDTLQRQMSRIEWEFAPYVERSHPLVAAISAELGIDADAAFSEAALL